MSADVTGRDPNQARLRKCRRTLVALIPAPGTRSRHPIGSVQRALQQLEDSLCLESLRSNDLISSSCACVRSHRSESSDDVLISFVAAGSSADRGVFAPGP
jgi:hypothetical protein